MIWLRYAALVAAYALIAFGLTVIVLYGEARP